MLAISGVTNSEGTSGGSSVPSLACLTFVTWQTVDVESFTLWSSIMVMDGLDWAM